MDACALVATVTHVIVILSDFFSGAIEHFKTKESGGDLMDDFDLTFDICDEDRLDFEAHSFEADEIEDTLKPKPKVIIFGHML